MGCDIHLHVEIKVNGQWHHYNHPSVDRHYALFARMAGVRNRDNVKPIAMPRGLPKDVTFTTKFDSDSWDVDGHSHSWLSSEEVELLLKEFDQSEIWEEKFGYLMGSSMATFHKYKDGRGRDGIEDFRIVFWFDN